MWREVPLVTQRLQHQEKMVRRPLAHRVPEVLDAREPAAVHIGLHEVCRERRPEPRDPQSVARRRIVRVYQRAGAMKFECRIGLNAMMMPFLSRYSPPVIASRIIMSSCSRLLDSPAAAPVASSASSLLRSWFEANYTRIPLREKDAIIKLEALYSSHTSATPPVHQKLLGKIKFAQMMGATYQNIGPHRASSGNSGGSPLRAP